MIGLYGVIAYTTAQRTQEIGVRLALGASTSSVVVRVVSDALRLVLVGLLEAASRVSSSRGS